MVQFGLDHDHLYWGDQILVQIPWEKSKSLIQTDIEKTCVRSRRIVGVNCISCLMLSKMFLSARTHLYMTTSCDCRMCRKGLKRIVSPVSQTPLWFQARWTISMNRINRGFRTLNTHPFSIKSTLSISPLLLPTVNPLTSNRLQSERVGQSFLPNCLEIILIWSQVYQDGICRHETITSLFKERTPCVITNLLLRPSNVSHLRLKC